MKTVIVMLGTALSGSCYSSWQTEMKFSSAELVRIDTVYRYESGAGYSRTQRQQLTWKDENNSSSRMSSLMHLIASQRKLLS